MPLTARQVENAPAGKHGDGRGLFLLVKPSGARSWVLRYQVHGRRRDLGLGAYPDITLAMARQRATQARRLIAEGGMDPIAKKQQAKPKNLQRYRAGVDRKQTIGLEECQTRRAMDVYFRDICFPETKAVVFQIESYVVFLGCEL